MSGTTEKLRQELQAAQRAIAGMQSQIEQDRAEQRLATRELEENRSALLFMLEDLEAARKKVELSYQEWMAALDAMRDPMFLHDKDFRILRCNKAYQQCAGIPFKQIVGQPYYKIFPKTGVPSDCCQRKMKETETEADEEIAVGDAIYRMRAFSIHDESDAYLYSVHVMENITEHRRVENERQQAEIALKHANRALAALSEVNRSLVYAADENRLLQAICQAIVEQRGYRMAWVGYRQHDANSSIEILARAGYEEGYLEAIPLTWAESEHGMVPSGRAIRSGTTQLCQDVAHDPAYLPWRDEALERGYLSSIALPLANSDVFGVLTVYAEEVNAFTAGEVDLLEEMAGDLAFGVRSLHIRRERDLALEQNQRQLAQLQNNLEDTVRAMAAILEMRDPYTAGHQTRVADLAAAIARQIGLPDEKVHAIHLAGVVHDLGKIQVPAEILSKPGRLIDIEYSLIKTHPQAGYDILKDIDFPWPIAQMVLQHHERLDGSGYPQGLRGEQIIPEARILCVADVVEAISAHRPYRPGLGIEAAFEEITKNRGILYDPQVVDACLVLFREQNYRFA